MSTEAQVRIQRLRNALPALTPITEAEFIADFTLPGESLPMMYGYIPGMVLTYGHVDKAMFGAVVNVYPRHIWHAFAVVIERPAPWKVRLARPTDPDDLKFPVTGHYLD